MTEPGTAPAPQAISDDAPDAAIEIRGLRQHFGDTVAVDGIDLRVERGEVFGLLGPERRRQDHDDPGGQHAAARAGGAVAGARASTCGARPMAVRRRLGYVPQQLSIEAALTGRENVTWFARLFDVPRARAPRSGSTRRSR